MENGNLHFWCWGGFRCTLVIGVLEKTLHTPSIVEIGRPAKKTLKATVKTVTISKAVCVKETSTYLTKRGESDEVEMPKTRIGRIDKISFRDARR